MNADNDITYERVEKNIFLVPLEDIELNQFQVRVAVDEEHVRNVAVSILANEMMQIPQARRRGDGKVELIFGHHRFFAHQLLAEEHPRYRLMQLEIVELSDEEAFRKAAVENTDRASLTVSDQLHTIELARGFGYSNERIGEELLHMGAAAVRSLWRLRKLPREILELLDRGEINQQTARRILTACQIADAEIVSEKILELAEKTETNIQNVLLAILENAGGIQRLPVTDGTTDKMHPKWDPGEFPPREWRDVSAAFPFREIGKGDFRKLSTGGEPDPDNRYQEVAQAMLNHMRSPGPCATCPFSVSLYKVSYCAISACARMKQERYGEYRLAQLSEEIGIAVYQESDGPFRDCEATFYPESAIVIEALSRRSADLRLVPTGISNHAQYYTNSYWAQLVWVGEKATEKPESRITEIVDEVDTQANIQPGRTTVRSNTHRQLIAYNAKILATYLKEHEDFVALALALMGKPVTSRTDLVYETVAAQIVAQLLDLYPDNPIQHLREFAYKFGIPLPEDWEEQILVLEANE
jgi:ParB-like chromosome segregation protein Spo0J